MIAFQPVQISDRPLIQSYSKHENDRSADFCFTNIFDWDDTFPRPYAIVEDRLTFRLNFRHHMAYAYPIGPGDLKTCILALKENSAVLEEPLRIGGVPDDRLSLLEDLFPGKWTVTPLEMSTDYIYSAEKLATLTGKKLHAKRNFINRFEQAHPDWHTEPVTLENLPICREIAHKWQAATAEERGIDTCAETLAIGRCFENFAQLEQEGILLYAGEEPIAFAMGEPISTDTYDVHFEKALDHIPGAFPMINREFARYIRSIHPNILYINREDDMGMENLRKSKLSYYPEILFKKYTVTWE